MFKLISQQSVTKLYEMLLEASVRREFHGNLRKVYRPDIILLMTTYYFVKGPCHRTSSASGSIHCFQQFFVSFSVIKLWFIYLQFSSYFPVFSFMSNEMKLITLNWFFENFLCSLKIAKDLKHCEFVKGAVLQI